jgi:hypothetical protein
MIKLKGNHEYFDVRGDTEIKVPGVTTILGDAIPKPALASWAARMAAREAVENWAELSALPLDVRLDRIKGAPWARRDKAAERGTEVHTLAEGLIRGEAVEVPPELWGHVESAKAFMDETGADPVLTESVCINRRVPYAGTFDLIAEIDRVVWLLDWKTGDAIYAESALQVCAYKNAEHYVYDGAEHPMPQIDRTGIVHIRADGYDLYPTRSDDEVFSMFRHAAWIARRTHTQSKNGDRYWSPLKDFLGEPLRVGVSS